LDYGFRQAEKVSYELLFTAPGTEKVSYELPGLDYGSRHAEKVS
jgi:hypothetical protein